MIKLKSNDALHEYQMLKAALFQLPVSVTALITVDN